ncbi:hypothetical protein ACPCIR_16740 [Mycobacterium sp. NPDC051198]
MAADGWPWPHDTREQRRVRVALMFRSALEAADPTVCAELDAAMKASGQHWLFDTPEPAADDLLTASEIAGLLDVEPGTIQKRIQRGRLTRHGINTAGHSLFRWGDAIEA